MNALTKEQVTDLKLTGNGAFTKFAANQRDVGNIVFVLKNLGHLPNDFNAEFLYGLLQHQNPQIRLLAAKNIGKLKLQSDTDFLFVTYSKETDTGVRREIVAAIGRQRNTANKPVLYKFLQDADPKVVCQAIRALLIFEKDKDVEKWLKPLLNHPNEMIRTVIYKEFFSSEQNCGNNHLPHTETYQFLKNVVVNADVLEVLKYVPDESIHLTFTSPPYYNARDYSIYQSYQEYIEFLENVCKEVHRITKEGRFLIVNTSPIIIPRVSRAHSSKRYGIPFDLHHYIVKSGWEFIDDIVWLKPEACVKNRVGGFMQHRKPLGYKPNAVTEYLMVYRKSTEKLLDWNMKNYDKQTIDESKVEGDYETTNVWRIDPCFNKVHTAVFPVELCKRVIQYYSYKGDVVFDPFAGSGTVGRTAKLLDRLFFLTEQNPEYFDYMKSKAKMLNVLDELATSFLSLKQFKETANDPY
ncbi:MAG: HEAT repeat domain-containing protein [Planctomycetaceae bacterium]|jgi:DNA modification methylase|nr:HEAT repeat domain-containing protein [Planctomycetaceae bacterium]